jgi:hypothetical protein
MSMIRYRRRRAKKVHTTHLVVAIIVALGTSNAQRRRSLGSDGVYSFKAWMRRILVRQQLWAQILVVAKPPGERVPDRHGGRVAMRARGVYNCNRGFPGVRWICGEYGVQDSEQRRLRRQTAKIRNGNMARPIVQSLLEARGKGRKEKGDCGATHEPWETGAIQGRDAEVGRSPVVVDCSRQRVFAKHGLAYVPL